MEQDLNNLDNIIKEELKKELIEQENNLNKEIVALYKTIRSKEKELEEVTRELNKLR